MSRTRNAMGLGLRFLGRFAGLPVMDRLRLRKPAERALYHASRTGFRSAGAVARSFAATQKLLTPARPGRGGPRELFDLTPSEEQQMLREAVASFAGEQLRTAAAKADTACA
ncbi:MAG TPA: acyl-CoA dehydrogenase, partial [Nevskia sp.]|nr:acyl-CoA dehydrogenase [Nevskia sp.]